MARLKIYTDENVDVRVAEGLMRRSITAFSAIERGMIGITDREHFEYALKMRVVIFTHDHNFIEMAKEFVKDGKSHSGVIYVDINKLSVGECIRRLALYAEIFSAEDMENQIEFL